MISEPYNFRTKHCHIRYQRGHGIYRSWLIFSIDSKHYLCIVDYHGKFPVMRQVEELNTDNLIELCKVILFRGQPAKQISIRCRLKLVSVKFKNVCKWFEIPHAVVSSYSHQSNGQTEACIMFVKRTMKNAMKWMLTYICVVGTEKISTNQPQITRFGYTLV